MKLPQLDPNDVSNQPSTLQIHRAYRKSAWTSLDMPNRHMTLPEPNVIQRQLTPPDASGHGASPPAPLPPLLSPVLPQRVEDLLFRMRQEAIENSFKSATASASRKPRETRIERTSWTGPEEPVQRRLSQVNRQDDGNKLLDGEEEGEFSEDQEHILPKSIPSVQEYLPSSMHADSVEPALFKIWPISYDKESSHTIAYDLEWEVPIFLQKYFAEGQELGNVLTVTGDGKDAQAQSCSDYLENTWPAVGRALLDCLQKSLRRIADSQ
jgi:hypothetical protein